MPSLREAIESGKVPLSREVLRCRVKVTELLDKTNSLREDGLLPNGESVASVVHQDGTVDLERIQEVCGERAAESVEGFITSQNSPKNPPWSRKTKQAQERAVNTGWFGQLRRLIRRGPGRHSERIPWE